MSAKIIFPNGASFYQSRVEEVNIEDEIHPSTGKQAAHVQFKSSGIAKHILTMYLLPEQVEQFLKQYE